MRLTSGSVYILKQIVVTLKLKMMTLLTEIRPAINTMYEL